MTRQCCKNTSSTATPFLTAARVLFAEGTSPDTELAMRHEGSDMIGLRATVGGAAALRVSEDDGGLPRFRPFTPFDGQRRPPAKRGIPE